jgi:hypothetical protein
MRLLATSLGTTIGSMSIRPLAPPSQACNLFTAARGVEPKTPFPSEDLNLIPPTTVAAACAGHWQHRLGVSVPFVQREDWCRHPAAVARDR